MVFRKCFRIGCYRMRCRTSRKRSGQIPRFGGLVCKWNQKGVCTVKKKLLFCFQVNQMNPIIRRYEWD